ncbi:aldolase/citrate lyase family protein [Terrihabitans rhizophilus]|uniref:Aldolase/citrate lyase family protein n=1 Tax=Terrihabitans rhizophilus TaxID=3092662 RepID=A0ABU4RSV0_9HYPH|nr:aldolase/citrate lyase family protein [Terrihabitans sp. PJ23]MDX6805846.1 aldolase/citrate lyase family protein [Terrihabitans sp. PJ23]
MDLPINHFKRAIMAGEQQIGLWSSLASNVTTEVLAGAGFDWLLIDAEHAPNDVRSVLGQLQAMMEYRTQPIVRVPMNDKIEIKRYIDIGVQSFLIPMVETADEARAAVEATRFAPDGMRGFAGVSRASRFGRIADYHRRAHEEICILVQVESELGIENIEAIAAVPGVDGVFIGPGDLSAAMGHLGNQGHADVVDLIEKAIRRIVAAGNRPGILTGDETLARKYMAAGCLFTAVGLDTGILARGAEALARKYKGA